MSQMYTPNENSDLHKATIAIDFAIFWKTLPFLDNLTDALTENRENGKFSF